MAFSITPPTCCGKPTVLEDYGGTSICNHCGNVYRVDGPPIVEERGNTLVPAKLVYACGCSRQRQVAASAIAIVETAMEQRKHGVDGNDGLCANIYAGSDCPEQDLSGRTRTFVLDGRRNGIAVFRERNREGI